MRLADAAWQEVDVATIIDQPDPVDEAEKLVEAALDDLVSTGALQNLNRMSIDALLNPTDELNMLDDVTEEEIYDAVMGSRMLSESGDDISDSDTLQINSESDEDCPTQKEALQAALILEKYVQHINDPFARNLEGMLGLFGRQTRLTEFQNMRPTLVTDYFSCLLV
jgi:hypothetical protein